MIKQYNLEVLSGGALAFEQKITSPSESQQLDHSTTETSYKSTDITRVIHILSLPYIELLFKQTIVFICISDLFVHERLVGYLIFLSNASFSSIFENAQFEITK